MDPERHEVTVDGQHVELTRREFDLLRYLLENKRRSTSMPDRAGSMMSRRITTTSKEAGRPWRKRCF